MSSTRIAGKSQADEISSQPVTVFDGFIHGSWAFPLIAVEHGIYLQVSGLPFSIYGDVSLCMCKISMKIS